MNEWITISRISDVMSELQAVPLKMDEGIIVKSTESVSTSSPLGKMNIPYPGKVIDTLTK